MTGIGPGILGMDFRHAMTGDRIQRCTGKRRLAGPSRPAGSGTGPVLPGYSGRVAISLTLSGITRIREEDGTDMNMQVVKWCVDLAMGILFLFTAVTGILKFTFLLRVPGITDIVLPMALVSVIHDRAGIAMSILVAIHLLLNRAWILSMTRKILAGTG